MKWVLCTPRVTFTKHYSYICLLRSSQSHGMPGRTEYLHLGGTSAHSIARHSTACLKQSTTAPALLDADPGQGVTSSSTDPRSNYQKDQLLIHFCQREKKAIDRCCHLPLLYLSRTLMIIPWYRLGKYILATYGDTSKFERNLCSTLHKG